MAKLSLVHKVLTQEKAVAFTFDDGPHPLYTKQILDIFRSNNGKATFFMIGQEINAFEDIATEVHLAGHEIANHTYSHPDMTKLTVDEARAELQQADERIRKLTGKPVLNFRPPFFGVNDDILLLAAEFGYHSIGAVNGEAKDWEQPGVDFILDHTRPTIENGSIFLFHDGYGERSQTIKAVQVLVEELAAEGYRFLTVSELLGLANPQL
ncbi:polysaccharide deacetylase family protein [Paenibacillus crassostreae]|uniref:Polysaccharide deacetylase n=1 Tax=Paenibacillus crassostreae TaxID=1763538 RepID=A0A167GDJ6_9BACL|nr:polysaccharide deacetylase family protein [Paenibacillus crassostreae]AOZ92699.1 polysaccharide deacetylase [Paenibacillus crassostreae]OAB77471.1 polysaccharide deacetylase [Paenibacillus crassostreae]